MTDPNSGAAPDHSQQPPAPGSPQQPPVPGYAQQPPAPAGYPQQPAPVAAPLSAQEDNQWAMLSHFLNIILLIPALIIFIIFKARGPRVAVESKEALNWTINVSGAVIILNIVSAIFVLIPVIGWIIWLLLTLAVWAVIIVNVIFSIIGGMKVKDGGSYRYPMNYRWIK